MQTLGILCLDTIHFYRFKKRGFYAWAARNCIRLVLVFLRRTQARSIFNTSLYALINMVLLWILSVYAAILSLDPSSTSSSYSSHGVDDFIIIASCCACASARRLRFR